MNYRVRVHGGRCLLALTIALGVAGCEQASEPDTIQLGSYRDVRAAWSPDGQRIVFRGERNGIRGLYLVDTSGANVSLLVQGEGIGASWSPDGRWIAYSSAGSLFRIRPNGDSLQGLTKGPTDYRPCWSPDGTRLAFVGSAVSVLRLDSMLVSDLTTLGTYPSWMPDGSEVVCLYSAPDQSSGGYVYSLIAVHVQTLAIRDLVDFQSVSQAGFVSINPTGQEAVLSVLPQAGIAQIWKIDLAAKKVIQLTTDGGDYPAWSPGGTWIVYTRVAEGDGGLWMMKADGSSKRRIT